MICSSAGCVVRSLFVALAAACAPLCAAPAGQGSDAATPNLAAVPAMQIPHAGQAMLFGTARAGSRIVAVGDHGVVMLSDVGGRSHRQARSVPIDVTLSAVSFVDERKGWAVGHRGVVLHTTDGGETWSIQRVDENEDRPLSCALLRRQARCGCRRRKARRGLISTCLHCLPTKAGDSMRPVRQAGSSSAMTRRS